VIFLGAVGGESWRPRVALSVQAKEHHAEHQRVDRQERLKQKRFPSREAEKQECKPRHVAASVSGVTW
jgi:hypothetical protein